MNTQLSPQTPDDADLLAAEYVLGVLDGDALRDARRRLRADAAFAADVGAWEAHFLPWVESVAPVAAPADAWDRIRGTLGWREAAPAAPRDARSGVALWRSLALAGFALAAVSAVALLFTVRQPPVQAPAPPPIVTTQMVAPDMVATLAADDGHAMFMASIDSRSGTMVLAPLPAAVDMPADRVPELWLIPPGGAPQSLGVLDPRHAQSMTIPAAMRAGLGTEALVAISVEPVGGSPTGQPTGPVVAKGALLAV